jgi:hypothetical protein
MESAMPYDHHRRTPDPPSPSLRINSVLRIICGATIPVLTMTP